MRCWQNEFFVDYASWSNRIEQLVNLELMGANELKIIWDPNPSKPIDHFRMHLTSTPKKNGKIADYDEADGFKSEA